MLDMRTILSRILTAAVLAAFPATGAHAQTAAIQNATADDALLAKAATLYYSTGRSGLSGFECRVRPDWKTLLERASPNQPLAPDDARVALLNGVNVTLHAQMKGDSTLDWEPSQQGAPDTGSAALLAQMHQATEQTLMGFLQFWTPFVDGSTVPASSEGYTVIHRPGSFTMHDEGIGTNVTEVFSDELLLQEFDVITGGQSIKFEPFYKTTPDGLLVQRFVAHIQPAAYAPVEEMRVDIEYQIIQGFPIPAHLKMEVIGAGTLNMALSGCRAIRAGTDTR